MTRANTPRFARHPGETQPLGKVRVLDDVGGGAAGADELVAGLERGPGAAVAGDVEAVAARRTGEGALLLEERELDLRALVGGVFGERPQRVDDAGELRSVDAG